VLCRFYLALDRGHCDRAFSLEPCAKMALTLADRGEKLHSETLFLFFNIFTIQTCVTTGLISYLEANPGAPTV